ncbi:MAG: phosphoadenylyl-sulfate reductase [Chloroflexota bacterium]
MTARTTATTTSRWTIKELKNVSDAFEGQHPTMVLDWGFQNFAPQIALATGFGPEGVVLMHLTSQVYPEATVFYLDTDLLFQETYQLRDRLAERLGLHFTRVHGGISLDEQAQEHGAALWSQDPNLCCQLRKVQPLREFLATHQAWITAIRRDQTRQRANAALVAWDSANGLVKLNPLAGWTSEQVWAHIRRHGLPYNPLHDAGYPSIGCWPCTRAVAAHEDPRAGRWAGFAKTECGIHLQPKTN